MDENLLFENEFLKFSFTEYPELKTFEKNNLEGLSCFQNNIVVFQPEFEYCRFDQLDNTIHLRKNNVDYSINFALKENKGGYTFFISHYNLKFSEKQTWIRLSNDDWEPKVGLYSIHKEKLILPIEYRDLLIMKLDSESLFYIYSLTDGHLDIFKNAEKKIVSLKLKLNKIEFLSNNDWELTVYEQNYKTDYILTEDEFFRKGLISLTGEIVIKNEYQSIVKLKEIIFLKNNHKIYLFSPVDNIIKELKGVEIIYSFSLNGLIFLSQENKLGAFNYDGKMIITPEFDKINYVNLIGIKTKDIEFNKQIRKKYLRVIKDNKVGFINYDGELIVPPKYDCDNECSTLINLSTFYKIDNPEVKEERFWVQVYYKGKIIFLDAENSLKEIQDFTPKTILPRDTGEYGNVSKTKLIAV